MRHWLVAGFVGLLLVPAVVASGEAATEESYKDYFDTVSYSGSNGSLDWSGPWVEGGENNGPASGAISIVSDGCSASRCLKIEGKLLGGLIGGVPSVRRGADLAGLDDARLHFRVNVDPTLVVLEGTLYVEARGGGSGWIVLADYALTESGTHSDSVDVSDLADDNFEVRFRLSQLLVGHRVTIDDVKVIGSVPAATTTSSSSTTTTSTTSTSTPTTTSSPSGGSTPSTTPPSSGSGTSDPAAPSDSPTTTVDGAVTPAGTGSSTTTAPPPSSIEDERGDDSSPPVTGIPTPTGPTPGDAPAGAEVDAPALTLPEGSGLRLSRVGLLADYTSGMMGDMGMGEIEVLGVSLEADFSMAVEAFEATRLWIAALALVIAAALVSGMDIRRSRRDVAELRVPDVGPGESETGE